MISTLTSIAALIVTLGILITVHEYGHFWVARKLGVKVLRFSVGFGKPLWKKIGKVDNTEFVVAAIPLGGYVKMLDEREGDVSEIDLPRAFNRQSVWARIAIVLAGPAFNFIFAIVAFSIMYMIGVGGTRPMLGEIPVDSPAYVAGFKQGDEIVAVGEVPTSTQVRVMVELLDQGSVNAESIITVIDAEGRTRERVLDVTSLAMAGRDVRPFESLGLLPQRIHFPAVIDQLEKGGAGELAGLKPGDKVIAVDGEQVKDWQHWAAYVRERAGRSIDVTIERSGQELTLAMVPGTVETEEGPAGRIGALGRVPDDILASVRVVDRYGPIESVKAAVAKTWNDSLMLLRWLGRMVTGKASLENLSGPITIAQFAGQTANIGGMAFLNFLAAISISLGVLNLLPIPMLDGGHFLYYLVELVKGSPVSDAVQELGMRFGITALFLLMGLAFFNDISRLVG